MIYRCKVVGGRTVGLGDPEWFGSCCDEVCRFGGRWWKLRGKKCGLKDWCVAMMMVRLLLKLSMDLVGSAGMVSYLLFLSAANDDDGWDLKCVKRI